VKLTKFTLVFAIVFFVVFALVMIDARFTRSVRQATGEYSGYISGACEAAMHSCSKNNSQIWTEDTLKSAVNNFYRMLKVSMNRTDYLLENETYLLVPAVCFVDYNGFYINYNMGLDDNISGGVFNEINATTEMQKFVEDIDDYVIQYYLYDKIDIVNYMTGDTYSGTIDGALSKYAGHRSLTFFSSFEEFEMHKRIFISDLIRDTFEYYINTQNHYTDDITVKYHIDMQYTEGSPWGRVLDSPCIMAVLQGKQFKVQGDKLLDVYGYSGQELIICK